ncbi:Holliday junction resolvase RuvX [Spiroplasma endosymbiont of Amphibalanus improvisus]|uniref:Holliday junction resolvase RuvX n=1 Tax=Spiroplasma endosymbiont of Amphibalanus improvisus TaxID=3066327 RepID=UPI00313C5C1C
MKNYLGIDLGTKTIGLAKSKGIISTAYITIRFPEHQFSVALKFLEDVIKKDNITYLVIGYPINMDGTVGYRAQMVDEFVELIKNKMTINIDKIDERLTSKMANNIMLEANLSRQKRKQSKDALAAQIILETFLQQKNK